MLLTPPLNGAILILPHLWCNGTKVPLLDVQFPVAGERGAFDLLLAVQQPQGPRDPFRCAVQRAGKVVFAHDDTARWVLLLHVASVFGNSLRERIEVLFLCARFALRVLVVIPAEGGYGSDGARNKCYASPVIGEP